MRVLFLVVLILAACATPVKQTSTTPHGKPKAAEKAVPAAPADTSSSPQQEEVPLPPAQKIKGWTDISGQNRDDAALYQDSAACHVIYKRAVREALQLYPEPSPGKNCRGCGTRNAEAVRLRQQNIRNHANAAYTECMESKGWRRE